MLYPWFCSAISQKTSKARGRLSKPLLELLEPQKKVPGGRLVTLSSARPRQAHCVTPTSTSTGAERALPCSARPPSSIGSRAVFFFSANSRSRTAPRGRGERELSGRRTPESQPVWVYFSSSATKFLSRSPSKVFGTTNLVSLMPETRPDDPWPCPLPREKDGQKDLGHRPAFGNHCTVYQRNPNRGYFEISHHEPSFESNRALELTSQIRPGRHGSDRFLIR